MVRVRPGKLPANVIVAPNSPSARAQQSTIPATRPGSTNGNVTRRKVTHRLAPSVAAAGKSTLLLALAGLVPLRAGQVSLDGQVLEDAERGHRVAAEHRRVGVLFQ